MRSVALRAIEAVLLIRINFVSVDECCGVWGWTDEN